MYSVKINKGKYAGVIVTYGTVGLKTQEDGSAKLSFQYNITESPKHNKKKLEGSDEFRNTLGDILSHIIESALESGKYKIGNGNKSTVDNPSEASQ